MSIRPFLSATKEDLDADCRPGVIDSVRTILNEEPVTMETWETEYGDPIELCRTKIENSSHYIGVFAYRRGWVPAELQKSITEAEFDWAAGFEKKMVVFLPNPTSPFANTLKERAKGQSEADGEAQKAFLKRVMLKTFQPFEDPQNLANRVSRTLFSWSQNGLRNINLELPLSRGAQPTPRRPSENEIKQLGRKEQTRQLEDVLDLLTGRGLANTVCFLIHGPKNHGHQQLASQLRRALEGRSTTRQYEFSLGPLWRQKTATSLIRIVGSSVKPDSTAASSEEIADSIRGALIESDVVMEIDRVDRLEGSLAAFVKEFWRPLASALNGPLPHRLVVLTTLEEVLVPEWEQYLQPSLKQDAVAFDPLQLVKLPQLQAFTEEELTIWLRNGAWVESEDAKELAQVLISDTSGGVPELLYSSLSDPATWNPKE